MQIEMIDNELFPVNENMSVQVKKTGHITEVKSCLREFKQTIQKVSAEEYIVIDTGELRQYKHTEKRLENPVSIKQSMRNLRDIINTNCTDTRKIKFLTLTYRENMQDTAKLYRDVKNFHKRFRYHLKGKKFEYISIIEPQGRGSLHIHELLIFNSYAPFIANDILEKIWGNGFVKITNVNNVDNLGAYLSAYLTDIPIEQANLNDIKSLSNIKEIVSDDNGKTINKHIIKGGRLKYYKRGIHYYRCSRGIKRPTIIKCPYHVAMDMVKTSALTYEKTIKLSDDTEQTINIINYKQYRISKP